MSTNMSFSLMVKVGACAAAVMVVAFVGCSSTPETPAKTCEASESLCNNECVDTVNDPANCGACGTACKPGEVCGGSACALTCGAGSTQCGASCADVKVDPKNCGACGTACGVGQVCAAGACVAQCPANQKICLGDGGAVGCVTTNTDSANCGDCGVKCPTGNVCVAGKCSDSCGVGEALCAGDGGAFYCSATQNDNNNCGACGSPCPSGQVCSAGKCADSCGLGEKLCSGGDGGAAYCAALQTDNSNCGACGTTCMNGQKCVKGACKLECAQGLTMCGNECVDTNTSRDNCGSCNAPCSGLTPSCYGAKCVKTCVPSGTRQAFNTENSATASGCWKGNPCGQDIYNFSPSFGANFQALNEDVVCGGVTSCVSHVGVATYQFSTSVCQGAWDVYCGLVKVGTIDTNGKTCAGTAMTNGCNVMFQPVACSTIRLVASKGSGTMSCCGGNSPDSMVTAISAW